MSLYLKYRPKNLKQVVGNRSTVSTLTGVSESGKFPHAMLFHGQTGCGKTTLARIVAQELGAAKTDFIELDSADFRGIDVVRDIRNQSRFNPLHGKNRVWIIDECHKMTNDAQNALLKLLEDTPKHVYLILCTTDPQKLIKAIRGRCLMFEVAPLNDKEMTRLINRVLKGEDEEVSEDVLATILRDGQGLPRNTLQILDKVLFASPDDREEVAQESQLEEAQSIELCKLLISNASWRRISPILQKLKGQDPEGIRRHVLGYCQAVLLSKGEPHVAVIMESFISPFYDSGYPGLVFACYEAINV